MASKATSFLIAARGHSTMGKRHLDAPNRTLRAFRARSRPTRRLAGRLDPRNRLSTFTRAGAASAYTWDANGNRLTSLETTRADTDLDGAFDAEDFSAGIAQSLMIGEACDRCWPRPSRPGLGCRTGLAGGGWLGGRLARRPDPGFRGRCLRGGSLDHRCLGRSGLSGG